MKSCFGIKLEEIPPVKTIFTYEEILEKPGLYTTRNGGSGTVLLSTCVNGEGKKALIWISGKDICLACKTYETLQFVEYNGSITISKESN